MARFFERTASAVGAIETSKWLWAALQGGSLLASFGVTAWAAWAAEIFSQYAPFSWVLAGFVGAAGWALIRLIWSIAQKIRVRVRYDAIFLAKGGNFNPLDLTFERKRIYLSDFSLPSHPVVENKTFIDCDLIGPANIYLEIGNSVPTLREPKMDGVWLHPDARFNNGFIFRFCIFRNCSFQRITMYAGAENYAAWKDSQFMNWIGVAPTKEMIAQRMNVIGAVPPAQGTASAAEPKLIEHEHEQEPESEKSEER